MKAKERKAVDKEVSRRFKADKPYWRFSVGGGIMCFLVAGIGSLLLLAFFIEVRILAPQLAALEQNIGTFTRAYNTMAQQNTAYPAMQINASALSKVASFTS